MKKITIILVSIVTLFLSSCVKDLEDNGIYKKITIKGTVIDSNNLPASNVKVSVTNNRNMYTYCITGMEGKFEMKIDFSEIDDTYRLELRTDEGYDTFPLSGMGKEEFDYYQLKLGSGKPWSSWGYIF